MAAQHIVTNTECFHTMQPAHMHAKKCIYRAPELWNKQYCLMCMR